MKTLRETALGFLEGAKSNLKKDKHLVPTLIIFREGEMYPIPLSEYFKSAESKQFFAQLLEFTLRDGDIDSYFIISDSNKTMCKKSESGLEKIKTVDIVFIFGESKTEQVEIESEYIEAGGNYVFDFPKVYETNESSNTAIGGQFANLLYKKLHHEDK